MLYSFSTRFFPRRNQPLPDISKASKHLRADNAIERFISPFILSLHHNLVKKKMKYLYTVPKDTSSAYYLISFTGFIPDYVLYNLARNNKPCHRRYKGGTPRHLSFSRHLIRLRKTTVFTVRIFVSNGRYRLFL